MMNSMFLFAMTYVFGNVVLDLYSSPKRDSYLAGILEEIDKVTAEHPSGLDSTEAVEKIIRADSAIRESMRLSDVGAYSMFRDVVGDKPVDIGDGLMAPPGTRMCYPTQPIHVDPDFYEDPLRFAASHVRMGRS